MEEKVHDYLRKTVNGKGSYNHIVPKFQEFVEKRGDKEYYVRGTYTHNNVDFTNDIYHIADLGFNKISMEPVICNQREPHALGEEDLLEIYNQYEILSKEMLNREEKGSGFTFYHYMLDLQKVHVFKREFLVAVLGLNTLLLPHGEIFPCHQFVGEEEYSMGNIWDGITKQRYSLNLRRVIAIQNRNVRNVGHSFTVAAVAQLIQYMQRVPLREHMSSTVKSSARG